jgi:hypothetical protein
VCLPEHGEPRPKEAVFEETFAEEGRKAGTEEESFFQLLFSFPAFLPSSEVFFLP